MSPANSSLENTSISEFNENGLSYIYDGPYPTTGPRSYDWINTNTKHMSHVLHRNNEKYKNSKYYVTIRINEDVKYVSSDLDSIVSYFIQHSDDFTRCCIKKRIELEYTLGPLVIV
jgi:hypothetical protein